MQDTWLWYISAAACLSIAVSIIALSCAGNVSYKVLNTDPHSTTVRAEIQFGTNGCCAGTGNSYRSACEAAAEATLEAWSGAADLCEAPTASHATPLSNTIPIITNNASTSAVSMTAQSTVEVKRQHIDFSQEGGSLSNAVAMLHMYLSAVASETTAPVFEVTEAGRLYECTLRLTLQGKKIDSRGTGHSKIAAKRVASGEVLRYSFKKNSSNILLT